jgi:uncharacterized membrane protein YoaK (UPF0700 family)
MPVPSPISTRPTVALLLVLTVVTGLVDAVSYLRLGHVFVANMTGNVVFLGFSADPHSGLSPLSSIVAILGFVVGAVAGGRFAIRLSGQARRWLGTAFAVEGLLIGLAALLAGTGAVPYTGRGNLGIIVIMGTALGVQNSTVRHFGVADLTTTVLSLTLTGVVADSKLLGGTGSKPVRRLGSIAAMLAGAAVGALLQRTSPSGVLAIAAFLVAVVVAGFFLWNRAEAGRPAAPPSGGS